MSKIKNELEELAFKYLEPKAYESLRTRVESRRRATEGMIEELKKTITGEARRGAGAGHRRSTAASSGCSASTRS